MKKDVPHAVVSYMTYPEYAKKRDNIAISEASVDVKAVAIEELDRKFYRKPSDEARKQIEESAPDPIKLGDD
jgi:hypothetical protein